MKRFVLILMTLLIVLVPSNAGAITTSRSFSSPSRSYSAPRSYSVPKTYSAPKTATPAPKASTPKATAPVSKPTPKPVAAPAKPKVVEKPQPKSKPLDKSKQFTNTSGQTVVYRDSGINPWMFWLGFGFLWYNQDNDKCYDQNHNLIECKEKK